MNSPLEIGLLITVHNAATNSFPLLAKPTESRFKLLFLDIGLLQSVSQVDYQKIKQNNLMQINIGSLIKQYIGQELLTLGRLLRSVKNLFLQREKNSQQK